MDFELIDGWMDEVDEGLDTVESELAGVNSILDSIAEEMGVDFCDCDCE